MFSFFFSFLLSDAHRYLHCLTPSVPTRRSSDLASSRCLSFRSVLTLRPFLNGRRKTGRLSQSRTRHGLDFSTRGGGAHQSGSASEGLWGAGNARAPSRSEEHTSELQSLMRISYGVFCLKKKKNKERNNKN